MALVTVRDSDGNQFEVGEEWLTRFPDDGLAVVNSTPPTATAVRTITAPPAEPQWQSGGSSFSPGN